MGVGLGKPELDHSGGNYKLREMYERFSGDKEVSGHLICWEVSSRREATEISLEGNWARRRGSAAPSRHIRASEAAGSRDNWPVGTPGPERSLRSPASLAGEGKGRGGGRHLGGTRGRQVEMPTIRSRWPSRWGRERNALRGNPDLEALEGDCS